MTDDSVDQEVASFVATLPPPPLDWTPTIGFEATGLQDHLREHEGFGEDESKTVRNEAIAILGRCVNPDARPVRSTGLAVGYVQSGKTTSFTMLSALAADNGFPLIIVLAGTKVSLLEQSQGRFRRSLRLNRGPIDSPWMVRSNPTIDACAQEVRAALLGWQNPSFPEEERKTVLLTVMKHHGHIQNLSDLLDQIQDVVQDAPVLIIDDEADQAGLNTAVQRGDESTTYSRIGTLRRRLPWHSYVMYTATPQAPLLISVIDMLSPDFGVTLTPGGAYTGGQTFFPDGAERKLVSDIPITDLVEGPDDAPDEPPDSLREALQAFLVGVVEGHHRRRTKRKGPRNRSMMVHPSRLTSEQGTFTAWIRGMLGAWTETLQLPDGDPDREELEDEFRAAYADVSSTVDDLLPFDEIVKRLPFRILDVPVIEMNTAQSLRTPEVNWEDHYANILVGGQVLDRGFTVEGLTVTYMPRGMGTGTADTLQQRARFFGYKSPYLGFCRVYLHPGVRQAFEAYTEHEEEIHRQLRDVLAEGQNLKDWRRRFYLDPALQPTRRSVLSSPILRGNYASGVWWPRMPHGTEEAVRTNRVLFQTLQESFDDLWQPEDGDERRTEEQTHQVVYGVPLKRLYENFIALLEVPNPGDSLGRDDIGHTGLCLQIAGFLEDSRDATADVYLMSGGKQRRRGLDGNARIRNLLQGANPRTNYPGDHHIGDSTTTRIQLHWAKLEDNDSGFTMERVPVPAIFLPPDASRHWVVQAAED